MKQSAGIIAYRFNKGQLEVLLVHPGGPFWSKKDNGCWSIPKGMYEPNEDPMPHAIREFEEETGFKLPEAEFIDLGKVQQPNNKEVTAYAVGSDFDASMAKSNTFKMEWPPNSGREQEFPEVDKAEWFDLDQARLKIIPAQAEFLDRLVNKLAK